MDEPTPDEVRELRELLAVILDALTPPYAATMAGGERRAKLIENRVMHVAITLGAVMDESRPRWSTLRDDIDYLRGKLAELPAEGYVTDVVARARREAGEDYMTSVREDLPGYTPEGDRP